MSFDCQQVDLHCHSTFSDGSLSPTELVKVMADAGIKILALTDHDSTDGLAEARAAASMHGLQLINGVEVSATWRKQTVHIVGLGIDASSADLQRGLAQIQAMRVERAIGIGKKLEKSGIKNALEQAQKLAGGGQITRTHFARLLVEQGHVKDMKRAFKRYLASGKLAYVRADWPQVENVIQWIHAAGGLAVLAHPMRYGLTGNKRRQLLNDFAAANGDALEVNCGPNDPTETQTSAADAQRLGLLASVGSDFHDPSQGWIRLGLPRTLPDTVQPVWSNDGTVAHAALA